MCSALEVPVSGSIPMAREKLNTTCAGVTLAPSGEAGDQGMAQHLNIRGEKRKALIDDLSLSAERSYLAVPAEAGVTAVLHECGPLSVD